MQQLATAGAGAPVPSFTRGRYVAQMALLSKIGNCYKAWMHCVRLSTYSDSDRPTPRTSTRLDLALLTK